MAVTVRSPETVGTRIATWPDTVVGARRTVRTPSAPTATCPPDSCGVPMGRISSARTRSKRACGGSTATSTRRPAWTGRPPASVSRTAISGTVRPSAVRTERASTTSARAASRTNQTMRVARPSSSPVSESRTTADSRFSPSCSATPLKLDSARVLSVEFIRSAMWAKATSCPFTDSSSAAPRGWTRPKSRLAVAGT